MSSLEQRANIKFCVLLEKSPSETLEMLKKAYGNDATRKTAVNEWHKGKVGQTVNKELYLEILKRIRDAIRRKRPEKWTTNDYAPPHCALIVKKYLARHSVTTLEHPPYSPDLAPADFYPFPRLKMKLKGRRFVDSDEVIENATKQLKGLSENGFRECFEQLYERWKKCVDAGGKYFEGQ
ncbi:hypothetical protein AVEN_209970-1 [Araneus ventricosus]|uniref:Mos1 transposase HTH domain-containing protein n=1 Tax=Araneus ventricosus TaxID=182803 RepID=A0A4Y2DBB7_ARAVE|nr:hypothetical protein AVEN_209970-1 [Araneus ventricosus]